MATARFLHDAIAMRPERRRSPRTSVVWHCTWRRRSVRLSASTVDVSLRGCFVKSTVVPAFGDEIDIVLTLSPDDVHLMGRVVYVFADCGFAVEFVHPDAHSIRTLRQWIAPRVVPLSSR
jgi:hypothetical protein